jgi:hypothetical protein
MQKMPKNAHMLLLKLLWQMPHLRRRLLLVLQ